MCKQSTKKRLGRDFSDGDEVNSPTKHVKLPDKENLFSKIVTMKSIVSEVSTEMEKLEKLVKELYEAHEQN